MENNFLQKSIQTMIINTTKYTATPVFGVLMVSISF